jgi:hypothetical protein
MPGATINRGYPYPLPADSINVPRDVQALAEALDVDVNNRPQGLLVRSLKATTEGGFGGGVEYGISGLGFTVPPTPVGRTHHVYFRLIVPITTIGSSVSQLGVTLRAQPAVTGALVEQWAMQFPQALITYPIVVDGWFTPTGLVAGGSYILGASSDGTGRFSINAGSSVSLFDVY